MGVIKDLNKKSNKTVDYFIDNKVEDLIDRAVVEGNRRRQIEENVADACADPTTAEGIDYLNSISDFSAFPKYNGRGVQDAAPDMEGQTLTMWFTEVEQEEVDNFIAQIEGAGFAKKGSDYVKTIDGKKYTMSVSTLKDKLRIFYKLG